MNNNKMNGEGKGLSFTFAPKTLEVNGAEYPICASDIEIIVNQMHLMDEYEAITNSASGFSPSTAEGRERLSNFLLYANAFIDRMLGEGAFKKISAGMPVGLAQTMRITNAIANEIIALYQSDIEKTRPQKSKKQK